MNERGKNERKKRTLGREKKKHERKKGKELTTRKIGEEKKKEKKDDNQDYEASVNSEAMKELM